MFGAAFLLGVLDRAVKSFAGSLLLLLGGGTSGLNVLAVDWLAALGTAGGAALVSVLFSFASFHIGDKGTSSMLRGAS